MLVLTRKIEERIQIGDDITITILKVKGNTVRVGIEAPPHVRVMRSELNEKIQAALLEETEPTVSMGTDRKERPTHSRRGSEENQATLPPLAASISTLKEMLARRQSMPGMKSIAK